MGQTILLRGARQLLTLRGPSGVRRGLALQDLSMIEDGSVLIRDGVIVAIGNTRRLENLKEAKQAQEIPAHGKVVMPAFIDPGLNLSLNRSDGSGNRKKTSEFQDETQAIFRACVQHGTLRAEVKARGYDGDYESVIPTLRQATKIGQNMLSITRTWRLETASCPDEDVMNRAQKTLTYLVQRKLIDFVDVSTSDFQFATCLSFLKMARTFGVGIKAEWSSACCIDLDGILPDIIPQSLQFPLQVDTRVHTMLARSPLMLVFSPAQEFATSTAPNSDLRALVNAGAGVALSSGYDLRQVTSVNMQMALALAVARLQLTVEEAITATTINAAWALGVGHRTGTLEVGKQADLMVLSVSDYRELARQFGINHVAMIIRNGSLVLNRTKWRPGSL